MCPKSRNITNSDNKKPSLAVQFKAGWVEEKTKTIKLKIQHHDNNRCYLNTAFPIEINHAGSLDDKGNHLNI